MTDLNKMAGEMLANTEQRERNGANISTDTFHMLKHCATEVVEATKAWCEYDTYISAPSNDDRFEELVNLMIVETKSKFASELADIICCCLIIAGKEQIDIEDALVACQKKNRL